MRRATSTASARLPNARMTAATLQSSHRKWSQPKNSSEITQYGDNYVTMMGISPFSKSVARR